MGFRVCSSQFSPGNAHYQASRKGGNKIKSRARVFFRPVFSRDARGDDVRVRIRAARALTGLDEDLHLGCLVRGSAELRRRSEKEGGNDGTPSVLSCARIRG